FYAEHDARVNATLDRTRELMKANGKTFEPVTYEGAGHGFMRAGEAPDASAANKKARTDAWQRWRQLLK
ncbi:MAG TPA: dienelactone hydrolase family protein, partial [Clostridia bacterium]|nr:dienelactone hydrolase family protein [Clostridia bacterium]